jgi:uncharacterized protein (DUF433 family)
MKALAAEFSPVEAAAFADVSERSVRKELEHGLLKPSNPPRLPFPVLVYLRALRLLEFELVVEDRRKVLTKIRNALAHHPVPETLELSSVLFLKLRLVMDELSVRVEAFMRWKDRLVEDENILGGEPVFPNSRLAVRHVGALAERGESTETILADYPYLTARDVEFAKLFARAYPRVGRPRESRSASSR